MQCKGNVSILGWLLFTSYFRCDTVTIELFHDDVCGINYYFEDNSSLAEASTLQSAHYKFATTGANTLAFSLQIY